MFFSFYNFNFCLKSSTLNRGCLSMPRRCSNDEKVDLIILSRQEIQFFPSFESPAMILDRVELVSSPALVLHPSHLE
jgi:hypothetical protein